MTQQHNEGVTENVEDVPVAQTTDHQVESTEAPETETVEDGSSPEETPPARPDYYPEGDWENLSEKDAQRIKGMRRAAERVKSREDIQAQELARLRAWQEQVAPVVQQMQQSQTPELVEPDYATYDDDKKYIADKVAYETQKNLSAVQQQQAEQARQVQQAQMQQAQVDQQWRSSLDTIKRVVPDFDAKVDAAKDMPVPTGTSQALKALGPEGASVYNYLLDNPEVAADLMVYEGNPQAVYQQLRTMVPLAYAGLAAPRAVTPAAAPSTSEGTAPAPAVTKRGGAKKKSVYDSNLSTAERMELLRANRKNR